MRVLALSLLICLGLNGPGLAQELVLPLTRSNPEVLRSCLASGKATQLCLGAMTVDCVAESDLGNLNLEERMCIIEERNAWIDQITLKDAQLRRRMAQLGEDAILGNPLSTYDLARLAWEQLAEAQCRMLRMAATGDARRAIIQDECARDMAAAQYQSLVDILLVMGFK